MLRRHAAGKPTSPPAGFSAGGLVCLCLLFVFFQHLDDRGGLVAPVVGLGLLREQGVVGGVVFQRQSLVQLGEEFLVIVADQNGTVLAALVHVRRDDGLLQRHVLENFHGAGRARDVVDEEGNGQDVRAAGVIFQHLVVARAHEVDVFLAMDVLFIGFVVADAEQHNAVFARCGDLFQQLVVKPLGQRTVVANDGLAEIEDLLKFRFKPVILVKMLEEAVVHAVGGEGDARAAAVLEDVLPQQLRRDDDIDILVRHGVVILVRDILRQLLRAGQLRAEVVDVLIDEAKAVCAVVLDVLL